MRRNNHVTIIHKLKINNLSHSASINYGPSIHFGHQANSKINNGEIVIGDEFSLGASEGNEEEENNNQSNENNHPSSG